MSTYQLNWWQDQLNWHELNRPLNPAWHDSQITFYQWAIYWGQRKDYFDPPLRKKYKVKK